MGIIDTSPSNNHRGSDGWFSSWTHVRIDRRSPGYCRVTFDHPPINTITAMSIAELAELVGLIEQDPDLNVVVFDSANRDFYLAHYDAEHDPGKTVALGVGPTGHAGLDRPPGASVPGAGGQHRRDSGTRARLGQFEAGMGLVPGGGPMARLSRRLIADDQLDDEVDAMASRLARFDRDALARTKSYVDRVTLPADGEFVPGLAD